MNEAHNLTTLIAQCKDGDTDAYRALYDTLIDAVYRYVRFRTSTDDIATDITQDIFVALYHALPSFTYHSREQFFAFVFVIARRALSAHYKHKHTKASALRSDIDGDLLETEHSLHPEAQSDILRALHTLDATTQEIVVLHHWSRYTFKEIASLMDMTESAVRVRHHRALKTLHDQLTTPTV